ncbi:MFS transporter, partial [Streptomyces solincola]
MRPRRTSTGRRRGAVGSAQGRAPGGLRGVRAARGVRRAGRPRGGGGADRGGRRGAGHRGPR